MDDFTKKSVSKFDKATVKKAEKLIDQSPELKRIRSIKDGVPYSGITTGVNDQAYKDGWERIFGNKDGKNKKETGKTDGT